MTVSKIKIKLGPIEIEYEGSEVFLKEELPELLSAVSDLYEKSNIKLAAGESLLSNVPANPNSATTGKLQATTGSIAAKLQVKSGPELILAAAARLTFVTGTHSFSRQKLIEEMKTATAYHKSSYISNLSASLNNLVSAGKLNEPSQGTYALTAVSLKELESRIV